MEPNRLSTVFPDHACCKALTGLTANHLTGAVAKGHRRDFTAGGVIWARGEPAGSLYVLERGEVEISRSRGTGEGILLRRVHAGEPFGELCLCAEKGGVRASSAVAVMESEAVEVRVLDFLAHLRSSGEALLGLVTTFCEHVSDTEARLEALAERSAEPRLALLLLHLARTESRSRGNGRMEVALYLSHAELARLAAMSRPHVTVTLGRFRTRGLVRYAPNRPLVVDTEALERFLKELHLEGRG